jgi:hypothetical protein
LSNNDLFYLFVHRLSLNSHFSCQVLEFQALRVPPQQIMIFLLWD